MAMIKVDKFCGARMRMARIMYGKMLEDIAKETGMTKKEVFSFEKEMLEPTKEQEQKLAKSLKVDPAFFYWVNTTPIIEEDCTFSPRMKRM